jgi:hypothetical protein
MAEAVHLEGGAKVYKDAPPGTHYVLECPDRRKSYFPSVEVAVKWWHQVEASRYTRLARISQELENPVETLVPQGT